MPADDRISILVVDDYKTMVRITCELLRQIGFQDVDGATDGAQALAMAREKEYKLVISDWNMDSLNGMDLLRALKEEHGDDAPRFIMATAESKTDRIVAARQAGADGYIVKPYTAATLRTKIDNLFAA